MNDDQTCLLDQTLALGSNPDGIRFEEQNGHTLILLGNIALVAGPNSQAALDKLATVAAQAAANNRARRLREVA